MRSARAPSPQTLTGTGVAPAATPLLLRAAGPEAASGGVTSRTASPPFHLHGQGRRQRLAVLRGS